MGADEGVLHEILCPVLIACQQVRRAQQRGRSGSDEGVELCRQ
jgi:hypothetical protein